MKFRDITLDRDRTAIESSDHSLRPSQYLSYAVFVRNTSSKEITSPRRVIKDVSILNWFIKTYVFIASTNSDHPRKKATLGSTCLMTEPRNLRAVADVEEYRTLTLFIQ
ncbi:hypothetical protein L0F63_005156 [Massospora cicadina]|nr:hypothetical protein L0F63_005156 [Massospora cicadina]